MYRHGWPESGIRTDRMSSIEETIRQLIGSGLVKREQVDDAMSARPPSVDALLDLMERRQYLTSYQSGRIRRGELADLVLGRYKLLYRNASGSFARVFRAASLTDNSMVALKLLRARWAKEPECVQNFRREANVCKRFDHLNIVPIYEVCEDRGRHFFTMEFVEGGNLRDFIRIRKKLSPQEGVKCLIDICSGLEYALGLGVTHRDLKMTNVLMSSKGVAKLVDFGLAGDDAWSGRLDGDGEQRALEYATLEKGSNAPRSDPRSDIFFSGAILYELISGRPAWPRTRSREERKQFSRYVNVQPLGTVDPTLPSCVTSVVDRMMAVSPDQRYQTPGEVVADLRHALIELGETPPPPAVQATKKPKKNGKPQQKATVLCVEDRPKHQEVLRDYFGGRGYRLLLMTDFDRAAARVRSGNPPDCLVVMGGTVNGSASDAAEQVRQLESISKVPALLVLSRKRADELAQAGIEIDERRTLIQPVNLKRLRATIDKAVSG